MEFFDTLKEKVSDLAQAGVAKSKRLADIAKLKAANMTEQETIKKAYLEIGKLYYAEKGSAPEGGYAAACEKITAAKANIAANNAKLEQLKEKDDEAAAPADVVEEDTVSEAVAEDVTAEDIADEEPKAE